MLPPTKINCDKYIQWTESEIETFQRLSKQQQRNWTSRRQRDRADCVNHAKGLVLKGFEDPLERQRESFKRIPSPTGNETATFPAVHQIPEESSSGLRPYELAVYTRAYAAAKKPAAAAKPAPAKSAPAPSSGGATGATPSGGTGKFPYQPTGKTWKGTNSGKSTRHYASGGSSGTTEWNVSIGGVANVMGVVYYTHPTACSGGHGDEADIKLWGPTHSNGGCCWCIVNINGAGQVCTGGEGPHPKTSKCKKVVGNVGSIKGKRIGLLHAIWKGSGGAHSEVWIDSGSGFKKIGVYDGACGNAKTSTTPSSAQQVQFRCDCSGVKVESMNVYEIAGGGGGGAPAAKKAAFAMTLA
jgi:hypothetical protein